MNKTSTNILIFYFDKAKQKNVCSGHMQKYTKIFVLLSRNNPLMLKGLKSVDLKIIQMYHCLSACLSVLLMNKTSINSLIFYFDKAKPKNVCSGNMKKYTKIFCLVK